MTGSPFAPLKMDDQKTIDILLEQWRLQFELKMIATSQDRSTWHPELERTLMQLLNLGSDYLVYAAQELRRLKIPKPLEAPSE